MHCLYSLHDRDGFEISELVTRLVKIFIRKEFANTSKRLPAALCAREKIHRRSESAPHARRFSEECAHPAKLVP